MSNPNPANDPGSGESGAGGEQNQDWVAEIDGLDDSARESIRKTTFKSPKDLALGHIALLGKLGNSVQIPDSNASEEDRAAFYKTLGRPDSPDGYEIQRPSELPEGMTYDEGLEKAIRAVAHEHGASNELLAAIFTEYNRLSIDGHKAQTAAINESFRTATTTLQGEWGANFKGNRQMALRAVQACGLSEYYKAHPEYGNDPAVIKAWFTASQSMGEANLPPIGESEGGEELPPPGGARFDYDSMPGKQTG